LINRTRNGGRDTGPTTTRHHLEYPDAPLTSLLDRAARAFGGRPAVVFQQGVISYRELRLLARRFARGLLTLGVEPGERVGIILANSPQFIVAFYGILNAGGVAVPVNPVYVGRELARVFRDSRARAVVAGEDTVAKLAAVDVEPAPWIIEVPSADARGPRRGRSERRPPSTVAGTETGKGRTIPWEAMLPPPPSGLPSPRPDDPAALQYTGGTTGVPKGAILTHRNLLTNALQMKAWYGQCRQGREVSICALPFFHIYGLTTALNQGIAMGSTLILFPRFDSGQVLEAIERHGATWFPGVPTMYHAINRHPEAGRRDLSSIKACISGAAPLPAGVQREFVRLTDGNLAEGYGLTEASPVTHCNPFDAGNRSGSIGLALPDTESRIVDLETGQHEVPLGETGELVVRGPQVMKGYWESPGETAASLRRGWLHTGDIARRDDRGYYYLVDRKKDLIITGGCNVYPREVEEALAEHPAVAEAAVVGIPDDHWGEAVRAYIVPAPGVTLAEEELRRFCGERVAPYKVPSSIVWREGLPRSFLGKVLRRVLAREGREEASQGRRGPQKNTP